MHKVGLFRLHSIGTAPIFKTNNVGPLFLARATSLYKSLFCVCVCVCRGSCVCVILRCDLHTRVSI